jgi:hypothetical protein
MKVALIARRPKPESGALLVQSTGVPDHPTRPAVGNHADHVALGAFPDSELAAF